MVIDSMKNSIDTMDLLQNKYLASRSVAHCRFSRDIGLDFLEFLKLL